jgi:hypothetical protein
MPPRGTPRDLIDLLADSGAHGREIRRELHANPRKVLKAFGVEMPAGSIPKPLRLPSPKKIKVARSAYDKRGFTGDCSETFALLIVVIGAIPFVADGGH